MPRFFEVNTDTDVLCYIPSGKVTETGQQEIQFMQEGDTCWFYATKRLANATGFQLEDPAAQEKYKLISNFRKTQSRLDSAVLLAATLLAKNCSTDEIYSTAITALCTQRGLINAFKYSPKIAQTIMAYIEPGRAVLSRQLKDLRSDAQLIQELVSRYRTYNTKPVTNDNETIQAIVRWLRGRNPYQSQLLECACATADGLSRLSSTEFSGASQHWSREPRKLIVHSTSTASIEPFSTELFAKQKHSVIILGAGPEATSNFEASRVELSVAQKQERRRVALIEFNQKITREMLNLFNMQSTTFSTSEELRDQLKTHGPVVIRGYYGESFYTASAHLLKDPNGDCQTLGTRQLMGWSPTEVKPAHHIDPTIEHVVTIIGIKYNAENPNRSRVLFMDPIDTSFPNEQRKVYSMSFERLCKNRSTAYHDSFTAHYSASDNLPEKIYKQETQKKQASTTESLLGFGLIASFGVACAGAVYTAYNYSLRS